MADLSQYNQEPTNPETVFVQQSLPSQKVRRWSQHPYHESNQMDYSRINNHQNDSEYDPQKLNPLFPPLPPPSLFNNRKTSVSSIIRPFRKLSDIIMPDRKVSATLNPFHESQKDELMLIMPDEINNNIDLNTKLNEILDVDFNTNNVTPLSLGQENLAYDHKYDIGENKVPISTYIDHNKDYYTYYDYDGEGDSMDGDVLDQEDRRAYLEQKAKKRKIIDDDDEVYEKCCSEARINCRKFKREMEQKGKEIKKFAAKQDVKGSCKKICSLETLKNVLPILRWAPKYNLADLQGDLVAGITVGLTVIPQSIAYSSLAGVPNENGLYSAFIGSFIYVLFGSSKDITLGPSAVSSLLASFFGTSPITLDPTPAIMLAFFVGFIEIAMFLVNFGYLINFVSFPVLKSFTVASAVTIAASQVKKWFGLKGVPRDFLAQFYYTFAYLPKTRIYDFVLGVISIVIIVTLKKIKEIPWKTKYEDLSIGWKMLNKLIWLLGLGRNIIVIILGTVVSYAFIQNGIMPFSITGYIKPGIPSFQLPNFQVTDPKKNVTYDLTYISTNVIGIGFIIVPVLGLLEAIAIGSVFARKFNYRIDVNQEFLAYGVGNVLTGLVGGYPITGTFSRTAVNAQCGVRTQAGGIFTGIIVLLALQFLTPVLYYIPDAALAVVIFMAVIDMITVHKLWIFWKINKIDVIPWIITLVLSFVINIAYGVIIGAGISLLLILYPATKPKMKKITDNKYENKSGEGDIVIVTFNTMLLYPAIENMKDILIPMYSDAKLPKGVILDFQHVSYVDTTTVQGLKLMLENFHKKNVLLIVCRMQKSVFRIIKRAKLKLLKITKTTHEAESLICSLYETEDEQNNGIDNSNQSNNKQPSPADKKSLPIGIDNSAFIEATIREKSESEIGISSDDNDDDNNNNENNGPTDVNDNYSNPSSKYVQSNMKSLNDRDPRYFV